MEKNLNYYKWIFACTLLISAIAYGVWSFLSSTSDVSTSSFDELKTFDEQFSYEKEMQLRFIEVNCDSLARHFSSKGLDAYCEASFLGLLGDRQLSIIVPNAPAELIRVCQEEALPLLKQYDTDCKVDINDGRVNIKAKAHSEDDAYFVILPATLLAALYEWTDKAPIYNN